MRVGIGMMKYSSKFVSQWFISLSKWEGQKCLTPLFLIALHCSFLSSSVFAKGGYENAEYLLPASLGNTSPTKSKADQIGHSQGCSFGSRESHKIIVGNNSQPRKALEAVSVSTEPMVFSCLISVNAIHPEWKHNKTLLIDVRRAKEFQKFKIKNSINLPAFMIKSKEFLSTRKIVLVNEGRNHLAMEKLCISLKSDGFQNVSVMKGGLNAWKEAGLPIIGDQLALAKLNHISPSELLAAFNERDWKLIDLNHSSEDLEYLSSISSVIEYQGDGDAFIKSVDQSRGQYQEHGLEGFLVVSNNGHEYEPIERLLQFNEIKNVLYLSGGTNAFKQYLNAHSSQINRLKRGFKETHGCNG